MFKIEDGREHFFQWDKERKLIVNDETIKEVHFCNRTDNCSLIVETYTENGLTLADVPNVLLTTDWRINVYGYDTNYTKHKAYFEVVGRTKPADYIYTETEVLTWEQLEKEVREGIEETKALLGDIDKALEEIIILQDEYKGLITFSINGDVFKIEKGTTWAQFIQTNPNYQGICVKGSFVCIWLSSYLNDDKGNYVKATDTITKDVDYVAGNTFMTFTVAGSEYYCPYGLTWEEFSTFDVDIWNSDNFSFIDNYVAKNGITLTAQSLDGNYYGTAKNDAIGSNYSVKYWVM